MNIIKKVVYATLLSLSSFSLTTSVALADGKTDAEATCPGCHGVVINGIQAVGSGGGRNCAQRSANEWIATIERMNTKGCGVPANSIVGIANYLICAGAAGGCITTSTTSSTSTSTTTSTTMPPAITCYGDNGYVVTSNTGSCPTGTISTPPPMCNNGPAYLGASGWLCPPPRFTCYNPDGTTFYSNSWIAPYCPAGTSTTPPPICNVGLPTFDGATWSCFPTLVSSTTTTSTTTTSSTTTTTLCNTYVNGTTQYSYSGSGSCHGFAIDDMSGAHIVRDQAYCKKHMSHYNSKGNHVHTYPHPMCM